MSWLLKKGTPLLERFTRPDDGCWEWLGGRNSWGYGVSYENHRAQPAHRVVYERLVGPIPEGLELDHLCRNRACCNPGHLEPVTRQENLRRCAAGVLKTRCRNNHELAGNTVIDANGWRRCTACAEAKKQRRRERHAIKRRNLHV